MSRRFIPIQPCHPPQAQDPLKGRGTVWALPHRFNADQREGFDDGWGPASDDDASGDGPMPPPTQVFDEQVKSILSANNSPDIGFDLSINPYRGCEHGCIYCYARPTHSYLNLSPGIDFETHIVAKVNAVARLRQALAAPGYVPKALNIGSVTDAYQPVERRLRITRGLIEVLGEYRHAFSVITKSAGVERDLDLIAPLAAQGLASVHVSVTTLDAGLARLMEPRAASPARRLLTIRRLADAGVPVGVSVSPMVPFLNEPELERILEAAREAGASSAFCIVLRLPWEVNPLFQHWLNQHFPDRAARVMARVREMRGGQDNTSRFGERMIGSGVWAQLLRQRFHKACARLGLSRARAPLDLSQFSRPADAGMASTRARPGQGASAAMAAPLQPAQGSLF
ncbi:PA0069 family radical SAM protein [Aquabacterium sp. OR-4]|uniref:PA0069 family radical SAM protein n=1 Tax=Aquabacterium sp. OR-4 TaxID=2978127 RepID=UPI0021B2E56E|nr:PA0069 family radical SAM protein [Aquabacterium sp. OR-4]MDT7835429.1 PA0069 family radical SAM protein [Aquabacterium sp. OR-4]